MTVLNFLFPALLGYLAGNLNLSRIITKYIGKFDITTRGSGNAGGTNVARTMGAKWGIITISSEVIKTLLVCLFCGFVFPAALTGNLGEDEGTLVSLYTALFCLLGNVFPVFYHFKGGKGVSTATAAAILLDWKVILIAAVLFFTVFLIGRMVSLGSLTAALSIPVTTAIFFAGQEHFVLYLGFALLVSATVIVKHHSNIKRLLKGTESKFTFGKKKEG